MKPMNPAFKKIPILVRMILVVMIVLAVLSLPISPARAATIIVDTTSDLAAIGGDCTLREAHGIILPLTHVLPGERST